MIVPPQRRATLSVFLCPATHPFEARPVCVDVGDGSGRTSRSAGRVAVAKVAFLDLARVVVVVDRPEGAGNRAYLAAHANRVQDDLGTRGTVDPDRFHRAGIETPRFRALRAGVGNLAPFVMKVEYLDARLGRVEESGILVRTGHFALQATGALTRIDVQGLLHDVVSSVE